MTGFDDILAKLTKLSPEDLAEAQKAALEQTKDAKWVPNPGPQTEAFLTEADVVLYGGEPGGGKSQLGLGLAFECHRRSLVMRREYGDLDRLVEDAIKIHGSRAGFNGSPPPKLKVSDEQIIDFAAAHRVGDEMGQMGKGHDLLFIDEATHFAESQIRFLMGWVRTEVPGQRCRTVLATNPPLTAEGLWVVKMFAPWLDPRHAKPLKEGELGWVVSDEDGQDLWVEGPEDVREVNGKMIRPTSRTYIHASVSDNPWYAASDYQRQLDAMPEPYRSLLMGGFKTSFKDQPNQCIPTAWILAAQKRWTPRHPDDVPMCALGVDASGGGDDPMVIAVRYDGWFDTLKKIPGKEIPMDRAGSYCAGQVLSYRRDDATVTIDLGGGFGSSMYEHLKANQIEVKGYKGAEATTRRSAEGKLRFVNKRSAAYWAFREALDPGQPGGSPIRLPPDPELVADLTAPTFEATPNGLRLEAKEKVCERLGRSTDCGDAAVMCWFEGARETSHAMEWMEQAGFGKRMKRKPEIITSGRAPLTAKGSSGGRSPMSVR